jgi:hypothetical protein
MTVQGGAWMHAQVYVCVCVCTKLCKLRWLLCTFASTEQGDRHNNTIASKSMRQIQITIEQRVAYMSVCQVIQALHYQTSKDDRFHGQHTPSPRDAFDTLCLHD